MHFSTGAYSADIRRQISRRQSEERFYDVIVVGVGSMGASACYHLARSGISVLGLEQFDVLHERGSHGGQSRLVRKAYFEHPDYVPLLEKAYQNWQLIEQESGVKVYFQTGLLYSGEQGGRLIRGISESARLYDLPIHELSFEQLSYRYPQFVLPAGHRILFEPEAGFVLTERAILAHLQLALNCGASIRMRERVIEWKQEKASITVKTEASTYHCAKLILTAGAWTGELSDDLKPHLTVTRQLLAWVRPKNEPDFALGRLPCWAITVPGQEGLYYGFPILPAKENGGVAGFKLALHSPGMPADPEEDSPHTTKEEERALIDFLRAFLPGGYESLVATKTCLYTNTPDEDFVIDFAPQNENVVIGAGFSGHGFKFASAVGEVLADLILKGRTESTIDFLSARRFRAAD